MNLVNREKAIDVAIDEYNRGYKEGFEAGKSSVSGDGDLISRQAAIEAIESITRTDNWKAAAIMVLYDVPAEQPDLQPTCNQLATDCISRQAAIDVIDKIFPADPMRNDYTQGITCGAALATEYIKQLPSAQPYTEDEVQKMQDLEQAEIQKAFQLGREDALSEIIRCKDCKHRPLDGEDTQGFEVEFPDEICPCQCEDGWYNWRPDDDWFCGDADMRGDNNEVD